MIQYQLPKRICFIAALAYPVLARDRNIKVVGGSEVQMSTLARAMARKGHIVSMICMNFGQVDGIVIDGVVVRRMHAPDEGIPVLRFVHPRLTSLWHALKRADADVYYSQNAGASVGFVAAFCRLNHRKFIFAGASDMDFVPELPWIKYARDRAIYRWGVRHADAIIAQSPRQQAACRAMFTRDATVINACYGHKGKDGVMAGPVIWVASIKPIKRPELFVELAESCPEYRFRIVGGGSEQDEGLLRRAASRLRNIEVVGFVPFADVEEYFDGASVLINTSVSEGLPNTFLQAWSRGIPTLSFFDFGATHGGRLVGQVATGIADMTRQLRKLKGDQLYWKDCSDRSRAHFECSYSTEKAVSDCELVFDDVLNNSPVKMTGVSNP